MVLSFFIAFSFKTKTCGENGIFESVLNKILVMFPAHVVGIKMTQITVKRIKAANNVRNSVKTLMEEEDDCDDSECIRE